MECVALEAHLDRIFIVNTSKKTREYEKQTPCTESS